MKEQGAANGFEPFQPDLSDTVNKICPTCGRWHSLEPGERVICDCGAVLVGEKEREMVLA